MIVTHYIYTFHDTRALPIHPNNNQTCSSYVDMCVTYQAVNCPKSKDIIKCTNLLVALLLEVGIKETFQCTIIQWNLNYQTLNYPNTELTTLLEYFVNNCMLY